MEQKYYIELIKKFLRKWNNSHKQQIMLKCMDGDFELVTLNETLAWASNLEDLCIMLFLTKDTRQDKNEYYWIENTNWGYNPWFLQELLKKGVKKNV